MVAETINGKLNVALMKLSEIAQMYIAICQSEYDMEKLISKKGINKLHNEHLYPQNPNRNYNS